MMIIIIIIIIPDSGPKSYEGVAVVVGTTVGVWVLMMVVIHITVLP